MVSVQQVHQCKVYNSRLLVRSQFLWMHLCFVVGVDSSEDDESDAEDLLPWQQKFQTTFSDSDGEAGEGDE